MVDAKAINASMAYADALKRGGSIKPSEGAAINNAGNGQPDFASMLRDVADTVVDNTKAAEGTAIQAAAQEAEIIDVVTALTNAEITLETVVAVRDKVVEAYQQIMRMPI